MSFIARSRANSEVSSSSNSLRLGAWVDDLFHRYPYPSSWGDGDPHHRVEIHFLGVSYLQSGPHCVSSAAFYEITETADRTEDEDVPVSPTENIVERNNLPPKKRRRHKVIRNDVVFCVDPPPASELHAPSPHLDYYLFPHDAVAEAVNETPPFEILFSFHVSDLHAEERRPTKLEEFAAVCSSANRMYPRRRSTDPGTTIATAPMPLDDPRCKVVNMRISGVSRRLFVAIKQTVSEFETVCEKMMQLMRYHTQHMTGQKGGPTTAPRPLLTPISPPIPSVRSEWDDLLNSRDHRKSDACSSDDTTFDKDDMFVDPMPKNGRWPSSPRSAPTTLGSSTSKSRALSTSGAVKKCLYCGSKSTPMWRRGPQGAGTLCNACGVKWKHGKILSGNSDVFVSEQRPPAPKERRGSSKGEKKRKKATKARGRSVSTPVVRTSKRQSDDDMESNINAARNLSIREHDDQEEEERIDTTFAVPWPRESFPPDHRHTGFEAHSVSSSSHSVAGSYSPIESSPSSSPRLSAALVSMQHTRRHTMDVTMAEKVGLGDLSFPMTAGVDAVEAAAVLTLLKRS
ncbi:hypothetical protein BJV82DRAFT_619451 [Fennellomyces sp. T-0311]|nr:hypothetical protein BJV82DRAFT_619451 [Fennellomyces sp. T-0311]